MNTREESLRARSPLYCGEKMVGVESSSPCLTDSLASVILLEMDQGKDLAAHLKGFVEILSSIVTAALVLTTDHRSLTKERKI